MLSFSRSQPQPNLYPQLPQSQQPQQLGYYPAQPGAMQPYAPAGPSQPIQLYQPPAQPQYQQVQQFQPPANQLYGAGGGQAGALYANPAGVPSVYQPAGQMAGGQLQQAQQGPSQQGMQLQQSGQGGNQVQAAYRPPYSAPSASTSLMPQPLESVDKSEDPIYGPLGRARGKVERAMRADEEISPDLSDMLSVQGGCLSLSGTCKEKC